MPGEWMRQISTLSIPRHAVNDVGPMPPVGVTGMTSTSNPADANLTPSVLLNASSVDSRADLSVNNHSNLFSPVLNVNRDLFAGAVTSVSSNVVLPPCGTSTMSVADNLSNDQFITTSNETKRENRLKCRPAAFDGRTATWQEYETQFAILSELNGWSEIDRGKYLAVSLTGGALRALANLPVDQRSCYAAIAKRPCVLGSAMI